MKNLAWIPVLLMMMTVDVLFVKAYASEDVNLAIGLESNSNYLGRPNREKTGFLSADFSAYGLMASISINKIDGNETLSQASLSYSYAIGFVDLSAGLSLTELPDSFGLPNSEDFFIELQGNPEWNGVLPFGVVPSLRQSFRLNATSANFTELKFEKEIVGEKYNLLFNPYVEIGAGEYYTDSWDLNHLEIGADLSWEFSERFYLSPYYSITKPLDALKEATGEDSSESRYGVQLRYQF